MGCYPPNFQTLGESHFFEVAPALFKPPSQKDAPAFHKTLLQEVPHFSCHHPFRPLRLPDRREPLWRGSRCRPLPSPRGSYGSPLPTLSHPPQIQHQTNLLLAAPQNPLSRVRLNPPGRPSASLAPHPTAEKHRASSSSLKSCTDQSQRNLFLPRCPSSYNARASGPRREEWRGQNHACAFS